MSSPREKQGTGQSNQLVRMMNLQTITNTVDSKDSCKYLKSTHDNVPNQHLELAHHLSNQNQEVSKLQKITPELNNLEERIENIVTSGIKRELNNRSFLNNAEIMKERVGMKQDLGNKSFIIEEVNRFTKQNNNNTKINRSFICSNTQNQNYNERKMHNLHADARGLNKSREELEPLTSQSVVDTMKRLKKNIIRNPFQLDSPTCKSNKLNGLNKHGKLNKLIEGNPISKSKITNCEELYRQNPFYKKYKDKIASNHILNNKSNNNKKPELGRKSSQNQFRCSSSYERAHRQTQHSHSNSFLKNVTDANIVDANSDQLYNFIQQIQNNINNTNNNPQNVCDFEQYQQILFKNYSPKHSGNMRLFSVSKAKSTKKNLLEMFSEQSERNLKKIPMKDGEIKPKSKQKLPKCIQYLKNRNPQPSPPQNQFQKPKATHSEVINNSRNIESQSNEISVPISKPDGVDKILKLNEVPEERVVADGVPIIRLKKVHRISSAQEVESINCDAKQSPNLLPPLDESLSPQESESKKSPNPENSKNLFKLKHKYENILDRLSKGDILLKLIKVDLDKKTQSGFNPRRTASHNKNNPFFKRKSPERLKSTPKNAHNPHN
jgi:hypothetical protein